MAQYNNAMGLHEDIWKEMDLANSARTKGNEGMARVCARRAAGIAVRKFLVSKGYGPDYLNNFEILNDPSCRKLMPLEIIRSLDNLTMRVDENYNLPIEIDLIADAENVISKLTEVELNHMEQPTPKIILYGTTWCGSTKRARRVLEEEKIDYEWIDIDRDESAASFVESVANGFRSVPTIVFPDGTILVEPSTYELREKLGL